MREDFIRQEVDERQPPSYWLLADNSVSLGSNLNQTGTFVAFLKHALLFHERLLLSDSLVVNTPNLRRAMQVDPDLREYLAGGCLVIARRENERRDGLVQLIELRESFLPKKSMNAGFDNDAQIFLADEDLVHLQRFAPSIPYDLSQVSGYYTDRIRDLLTDVRFLGPLGSDSDKVCEAILRRIGKNGIVDQTFFKPGVPDSLPTILGEHAWNRHAGTIGDFEAAYYRNAIPSTLGADVVFSHEHLRQRQILRDVGAQSAGEVRIDLSRSAKSLYEAALSKLTAKTLSRLRDSREFFEFQKSLKELRSIVMIHDPRLNDSLQNLYAALDAYHVRIDEELRIRRFFDRGSRFLDQWNLRGFLMDGAYLLRWGAEAASRKQIRALAVSSLARIVDPLAADACLTYYAVGGIKRVENLFDDLPKKLATFEKRQQSVSSSSTPVKGELVVAPRAFKDSIYGETRSSY